MIPLKDNISSKTTPVVNISLIIINIMVFVYELNVDNINVFLYNNAFIPNMLFVHLDIFHSFERMLESMFFHGGFLHILGNMWFLWIFGDNVEDVYGHINYLFLYFFGGLIAFFAQGIINPSSTVPIIGASGAISAVVGSYFILFPKAKILSLILIIIVLVPIWVPAWLFIILWFFIQYFSGILSIMAQGASDVAWFAHIGGFLFGIVAAKYMLSTGRIRI